MYVMQLKRFAPLFALLMAFALLGACASTAHTEGTGEYIDDTVITAKVKAEIFNDPSLKSSEINVETFKGRVQLSGFVNSREDINRAVALARGVSGVKSVSNDMRLK
jgi:osmotically-inducible protein OsmY